MGPAVADTVDLCAVICGEIDETERALLDLAVRQRFEAAPVVGDVAASYPRVSPVGCVLACWVEGSLGRSSPGRPTSTWQPRWLCSRSGVGPLARAPDLTQRLRVPGHGLRRLGPPSRSH